MAVETNRYCHLFLENSDDGPFPPTWGDRSRNACVLASDITDRTHCSWQTGRLLEENRTIGQTMVRARYYDILRLLHFTENKRNGVDRTDDRLENKRLI